MYRVCAAERMNGRTGGSISFPFIFFRGAICADLMGMSVYCCPPVGGKAWDGVDMD